MSALAEPKRAPHGELTEIQVAILIATMECTQPVGAYKIVRALRPSPEGVPMYPESSLYREVKNLASWGFLEADEVDTSRGTQTRYQCTWKAAEAVRAWVQTPLEIPIEARNELWLRIAAVRFSRPKEVLRGLAGLEDDLDYRTDRLNVSAREARKFGRWGLAEQLEYQLELVMIEAARRWLTDATGLLRARIEELGWNREAGEERPKR